MERAYYTASQPGFLSSYHIDRRLGKIFKCFENIWLEKIFDPRCNSTVSTLKYFLSCWINIFSVHPRVHWDLVKSLSRRVVWWAVLQWWSVLMMELHLVLVWRKRLVNTALLPPLLSETDFISSQFQQIQMLICSWWKTSLYCKVYVGCASQTQLMKSKENIWTSTFVNHLFTVNTDSLWYHNQHCFFLHIHSLQCLLKVCFSCHWWKTCQNSMFLFQTLLNEAQSHQSLHQSEL